jgi:hypothetical protein
MTRLLPTSVLALAALLGGCVVPPNAQPGLMDVAERPAEKALLAGMRAYEDAQYPLAEAQLGLALKSGLALRRPTSTSHSSTAPATASRPARTHSALRAQPIRPSC